MALKMFCTCLGSQLQLFLLLASARVWVGLLATFTLAGGVGGYDPHVQLKTTMVDRKTREKRTIALNEYIRNILVISFCRVNLKVSKSHETSGFLGISSSCHLGGQ